MGFSYILIDMAKDINTLMYQKFIVVFHKAKKVTLEGEFGLLEGKEADGTPIRNVRHGKKEVRMGRDLSVEPITVGPLFARTKKEAVEKALEGHPELRSYYYKAMSYKDILRERKKQSNESK